MLNYVAMFCICFAVCNNDILTAWSLAGQSRNVTSGTSVQEICCFQVLDPRGYSANEANLSASSQDYACEITSGVPSDDGITVKIGDDACCTVDNFTAPYEVSVSGGVNPCNSALSQCQTQIIFVATYDSGTEETSVSNSSTEIFFHNFTRIEIHYQVCGDDVLQFSLPVSSSGPLNIVCSPVSSSLPPRAPDSQCSTSNVNIEDSSGNTTSPGNATSNIPGGPTSDSTTSFIGGPTSPGSDSTTSFVGGSAPPGSDSTTSFIGGPTSPGSDSTTGFIGGSAPPGSDSTTSFIGATSSAGVSTHPTSTDGNVASPDHRTPGADSSDSTITTNSSVDDSPDDTNRTELPDKGAALATNGTEEVVYCFGFGKCVLNYNK